LGLDGALGEQDVSSDLELPDRKNMPVADVGVIIRRIKDPVIVHD
jgi:hypothetical protein